MTTRNARIEEVKLYIDDHGFLACVVELDYGSSCQGFGAFDLYNPDLRTDAFAGHFLMSILRIADVQDWKQLVGKIVRVKLDDGLIKSIGHVIHEDWFTPTDFFKK